MREDCIFVLSTFYYGIDLIFPMQIQIFHRLFVLLAFLVFGVGNSIASCVIPGTIFSCNKLVDDLPWQFQFEQDSKDDFYLRMQSQEGTGQPGVSLKITLEVGRYESNYDAEHAFAQALKKAHPDMGLSYGWDLILVRSKRFYHLHADCTLAEQYFNNMAGTLREITDMVDNHKPLLLYCRCGGGCKLTE